VSRHSELFQRLAGLPNCKAGDLPGQVSELIEALAADGFRLRGSRDDFVERGRREYLRQLAQRGRHHLRKASSYQRKATGLTVVPHLGRDGDRLRDFYHDCYYASFYAVRHGLVQHDSIDCTMHAELPKALERFRTRRPTVAAPLLSAIDKSKIDLAKLSELRNVADYIINLTRLSVLATGQQVDDAFASANGLYSAWGVP
jgi:hypothetical protein